MSRWGAALAGAAGAVANVGVQALDRQIQIEQTIAAEQRAADLKLDMAQRLAAAEEMRQNAALARYNNVVQGKLAEPVPLEPGGVDTTGVTRESAQAIGLEAGFAADPTRLAMLEQQFTDVLNDPRATPEQKADAQGVLAQLERQKQAQGELNSKGKTRTRTFAEARDAAFQDPELDATAAAAGHSRWKDAMTNERTDKKDAAASREKELDRKSLERRSTVAAEVRRDIATAETERKTAADRDRATNAAERVKAIRERTESLAGGKGQKATALMQNVEFLRSMGYGDEAVHDFVFKAKDSSQLEKAIKIVRADQYGETTLEQAIEQVQKLEPATSRAPRKPVDELPPGAKQIGTKNGKPVYQTPDGKRFILE